MNLIFRRQKMKILTGLLKIGNSAQGMLNKLLYFLEQVLLRRSFFVHDRSHCKSPKLNPLRIILARPLISKSLKSKDIVTKIIKSSILLKLQPERKPIQRILHHRKRHQWSRIQKKQKLFLQQTHLRDHV